MLTSLARCMAKAADYHVHNNTGDYPLISEVEQLHPPEPHTIPITVRFRISSKVHSTGRVHDYTVTITETVSGP